MIWETPEFVGGAPVEHYELRYRTRELVDEVLVKSEWQAWPHSVTTTSASVTGLEIGVAYGVQVRAVNANGPGQWSFESFGRTGEPDHICEILEDLTSQ